MLALKPWPNTHCLTATMPPGGDGGISCWGAGSTSFRVLSTQEGKEAQQWDGIDPSERP